MCPVGSVYLQDKYLTANTSSSLACGLFLYAWGAKNDLQVFKGKRYVYLFFECVTKTACGPQSLKHLLFSPLQKEFAYPSVED